LTFGLRGWRCTVFLASEKGPHKYVEFVIEEAVLHGRDRVTYDRAVALRDLLLVFLNGRLDVFRKMVGRSVAVDPAIKLEASL
jgi:hypothetical protein